MNIVQVCNYKAPACDSMGAERIVERISKGLVSRGHNVSMLLARDSTLPVSGAYLTDKIGTPDIVHYHGWEPDEYEKTHVPWVTTIHGYMLHKQAEKAAYSKNVIAVSEFAARRIGAAQYVWNCADPDEFTYQEKKQDYFLWMAGTDWGEGKGLYTTLDLAKMMQINMKFAGTGQDKQIIKDIQDECDSCIEYLGAINGKEKVELIKNAKALILLTQLPDACPVSVSEALMCGTPVIGSANGSMPEIILNNVTGFICNTLPQMMRAITTIDRIHPKTCREYAEKNFSTNVCVKKYEHIYEKVIAL